MSSQLSFNSQWDPPSAASSGPGAAGRLLGKRRGVSFFELPCRSVLNRCTSERMPFQWTINPYRGCEFGCTYCYARYSHEFLGMEEWLDFQEKILVKRSAPTLLPKELTCERMEGKSLAIGTVTDPYQPAEREFRVTRGILERLVLARNLTLSITTKSALITRDLELLLEIASRSRLSINISLITLNRRLARILEPRAPTPERRIATIRQLARAGLKAGIFAMPVLPGLTDSARGLEALVKAAAGAGATHFVAQMLFLRGSALKGFLPRLEKDFPALVSRYRREYARSAYQSEVVRERLALLVSDLKRRYPLGASHQESLHSGNGKPARSANPVLEDDLFLP
jgi:DNA repair photolyase